MATEQAIERAPVAGRARGPSHPDRLAVALFSLAAFLVVLALLAGQLRAAPVHAGARSELLIRKIYRTTVVETIVPGGGADSTSVSRSVAGAAPAASAAAPAPTTRTS